MFEKKKNLADGNFFLRMHNSVICRLSIVRSFVMSYFYIIFNIGFISHLSNSRYRRYFIWGYMDRHPHTARGTSGLSTPYAVMDRGYRPR